MKKNYCFAIMVVALCLLFGTSCSAYDETHVDYESSYDSGYESGYHEGYVEGYDEGYWYGVEKSDYSLLEGPVQLLVMLDEANGDAEATKYVFDFAEAVGYWPSSIFGPYCLDTEEYIVHDTDSPCVEQLPYENRMSSLVYRCFTLEEVENVIKNNNYLSQFNYTFCPRCIQMED